MAFYRRINFSNYKKNFPKKDPVLVVTNHNTACAEQMLVATFQKRGVYFWARASVFPGGFADWLFKQGHLIPVYRPQEGFKNMYKNKEIFKSSQDLLLENKVLYIAPEGKCVRKKRLRTFKTGSARIALGAAAETNFTKDIKVLPAGVNYTHHTNFRSDVMISFGQSISMLDYKELYEENPQKAVRQLTEDMKMGVRKEMIHIENPDDDELAEQLFTLSRSQEIDSIFPLFSTDRSQLETEQNLAEMLNTMNPSEKEYLQKETKEYFEELDKEDLDDQAVAGQNKNNWFRTLGLLSFFPIFIMGYIAGWLPMNAARYLRKKNVKDLQFWAPTAIVFAALTWTIYSTALIGIGAFFMGWSAILLAPTVALGQYITLYYQETWKRWLVNYKYTTWKNQSPEEALQLEEKRGQLMHKLQEKVA
ncbi:MAG: 1-acyl-sn-glycerol-3-phosphate acyltransferase [Saprospiraceae bacterium]|nr:1-acyl-sn-glycerol-3-phosphate acyltransferase [Saprospiraceae bacterium]